MKKSKSLWPGVKKLATMALSLLLACESQSQSRPPVKKKVAPVRNATQPPPLALTVDSLSFSLARMSLFLLPGESVDITAGLAPAMQEAVATCRTGKLERRTTGEWRYTAPSQPKEDMLSFSQQAGPARAQVRICTLIPAENAKKGHINGYHIGDYVTNHANPIYTPPRGYYEVLGTNATEWLTDHVQMRDIVSKQIDGYPRYIVLQPKLLVKLEAALSELQKAGVKVRRFSFISGYRTPFYNAKIENVGLSRHQYGDAADVFIDYDNDGYMDDLNHDGASDLKDAQYLAAIVNKMDTAPAHRHLLGGLGVYRPKGPRTPFVHIDTRGYKARWVN